MGRKSLLGCLSPVVITLTSRHCANFHVHSIMASISTENVSGKGAQGVGEQTACGGDSDVGWGVDLQGRRGLDFS